MPQTNARHTPDCTHVRGYAVPRTVPRADRYDGPTKHGTLSDSPHQAATAPGYRCTRREHDDSPVPLSLVGQGYGRPASRLQEVRPSAPRALAAQIARVIALLAPVELGLLRPPFHEPFHGDERGKAEPGQPRHRPGLSAGIGQLGLVSRKQTSSGPHRPSHIWTTGPVRRTFRFFREQNYHALNRQDAARWADLGTYRA